MRHIYLTNPFNVSKVSFITSVCNDSNWSDQIKVIAMHSKSKIGELYLRQKTGQIGTIEVKKEYRRNGVATKLVEYSETLIDNHLNLWVLCTSDHYFWSKQKHFIYSPQIPYSLDHFISADHCGYIKTRT